MESKSFDISKGIIFRANIFNYDNKFFEDFRNRNRRLDLGDFSQVNHKNILQHRQTVTEFLNRNFKDQIDLMSSLLDGEQYELIGGQDQGDNIDDENHEKDAKRIVSKEARIVLQVLLDVVNTSSKLIVENEEERLKNQEHLDDDEILSKKTAVQRHSDNLLLALLYLDGLIMTQIDLISVINNQGPNVGVVVDELFYNLLYRNQLETSTKEIASHLLSASLSFTSFGKEFSNDKLSRVLDWTFDYCLNTERRRDNCLTSNLCLLLADDRCLNLFMARKQAFRDLIKILTRDNVTMNTTYETLFCIWNISSNENYTYLFENKDDSLLERVVHVIKNNKIDKITRIGLIIIKVILYNLEPSRFRAMPRNPNRLEIHENIRNSPRS